MKKLSKALVVRRVQGQSMSPTLSEGQIVIASSFSNPVFGDIVVAKLRSGREVVKRFSASHSENQQFQLTGDNPSASTDYSHLEVAEIYGRLLWPRV